MRAEDRVGPLALFFTMIHILRWEWWPGRKKWFLRITWGPDGVVTVPDPFGL